MRDNRINPAWPMTTVDGAPVVTVEERHTEFVQRYGSQAAAMLVAEQLILIVETLERMEATLAKWLRSTPTRV